VYLSSSFGLSMKMAVFWVVASCKLVDTDSVSEVLSASITRAMSKPRAEEFV
jgi:hypothetical protein